MNAVAPGLIKTSGLSTYNESFQKELQHVATKNYTMRMGTEAEVASAILFLLSPAAAYITGSTVQVDGGEPLFTPLWPPSSPYQAEFIREWKDGDSF